MKMSLCSFLALSMVASSNGCHATGLLARLCTKGFKLSSARLRNGSGARAAPTDSPPSEGIIPRAMAFAEAVSSEATISEKLLDDDGGVDVSSKTPLSDVRVRYEVFQDWEVPRPIWVSLLRGKPSDEDEIQSPHVRELDDYREGVSRMRCSDGGAQAFLDRGLPPFSKEQRRIMSASVESACRQDQRQLLNFSNSRLHSPPPGPPLHLTLTTHLHVM